MKRDQVIDAIATILHDVEPTLETRHIMEIIEAALTSKSNAILLLESVTVNPDQLTNGSDAMDPALARIIRELVQLGAQAVQEPRCYRCQRTRPLPSRVGSHRICATCYKRERTVKIQCSMCHQVRRRRVEISGQFWCGTCWERLLPTAHETLLDVLQKCISGITTKQAITTARELSSSVKPGEVLRAAVELDLNAAQWLEHPASGSRLFVKLHAALRATGVALVPLACGRCNAQPSVLMRHLVDGVRCCARCYRQSQQGLCIHCGRMQIIVTHDADGNGMCQTCKKNLPENKETCSVCGSLRFVVWQGPSGPVCSVCRPRQRIDVCTQCHRRKPCLFAGTPKARCHECSKPQKSCGQCGKTRRVLTYSAEGEPLCHACGRRREPCTNCGTTRIVVARVNGAAWCEYCYKRNSISHRDCVRCGAHKRPFSEGLCTQCAADDALEQFIPASVRATNPVAQSVHDALRSAKPSVILTASRRKSASILQEVINSPEKLNHDYLDNAGPDGLTRGIRSLLIDAGLLELRDHHLARFEKWILEVSTEISNAKLRAVFVQYARWRHVRELRKKRSPLPSSLTVSRRRELRLILELISWVHGQGRVFGSLTQLDVDRWRSFGSKEKYRVSEFLVWAHRNRLVRRIEIQRPKRTDLNVVGFSDAKRTEILENLLDEQCLWPAIIRFSALLVLLFGTRPLQITRLKVSDIFFRGPDAYMRLGRDPVLLPDVLTQLASTILNDRAAIRQFTTAEETHWLLPGTVTGYPMSSAALAVRLRNISIPASTARTSAMSMLTQNLPPTIVARLTGTTQGTAIRWMDAVAASNARYAAFMINPQGY